MAPTAETATMPPPGSDPQAVSHAARPLRPARPARAPEELPANVLELLRPGSFVRLRNQPEDLPPFQLIVCRGGRCWVRQQTWGQAVQWEVAHRQLTAVA